MLIVLPLFGVITCMENLEMSGFQVDSCHGNVRDFTTSQGSDLEKILSGKRGDEQDRWSKPDYLLVFKIVLTLLSLCISFGFCIMHCCIPTLPLTITLVQA